MQTEIFQIVAGVTEQKNPLQEYNRIGYKFNAHRNLYDVILYGCILQLLIN